MYEGNVTFSDDFLKLLSDIAMVNFLTSFLPEDDAETAKSIFRAFAKHGVPANIVLEVIKDLAMEGGFKDG